MDRLLTAIQIVCLSTWAAIVYGVLHDQVTVRVCLEYFTIGHVPIFGDQPPTILAILWGTVATWWMGAFLGTILALAATVGPYPLISARGLVRPLLTLLAVMAVAACFSGTTGYLLAQRNIISLESFWAGARLVPAAKHAAFLADGCAHDASYVVGFFGGLFLALRTLRLRRKMSKGANL